MKKSAEEIERDERAERHTTAEFAKRLNTEDRKKVAKAAKNEEQPPSP